MSVTAGISLDHSRSSTQTPDRADVTALVTRKVVGHEWDAVISGFDGICQEQLYAFASIRWPGVTPEPRLFERDGRIVGGALVMVQRLPLGLANIAIIKWGPMLADARAKDKAALHASMVEALITEYARERGMMLSILPHASVLEHNGEYQGLRARGFKRGALLRFPDRYLVNLRQSDEAQRKSFDQTWRRQLNKAGRSRI